MSSSSIPPLPPVPAPAVSSAVSSSASSSSSIVVRVQVPRVVSSRRMRFTTAGFYADNYTNNAISPPTPLLLTPQPDRFIPNRQRMTNSSGLLFHGSTKRAPYPSTPAITATKRQKNGQEKHYERQLRRVLLGNNDGYDDVDDNADINHQQNNMSGNSMENSTMVESSSPRLLVFGPKPSALGRCRFGVEPVRLMFPGHNNDDPYRQDILRSRIMDPANSSGSSSSNSSRSPRYHHQYHANQYPPQPRVSIECVKVLDAPNLNTNGLLGQLVGSGKDYLAVALGDKVYLWCDGKVALLASCREGCLWTSVSWSPKGDLLALGSCNHIQIYRPRALPNHAATATPPPGLEAATDPLVASWQDGGQRGHVFAITWKEDGTGLAAAFQNGEINRFSCDTNDESKEVGDRLVSRAIYQRHCQATGQISLAWKGNLLASARASNGLVMICDATKIGDDSDGNTASNQPPIAPDKIMEHSGVQALEFCPTQPNLLVSGGDGGLKFWNTWNGKLRGVIEMSHPVKGLVCSSINHEVLVAGGGNKLTLWNLESRRSRILEHPTGSEGDVLSVVRGLTPGSIVCANDNETLTLHAFRRAVSKETARSTLGMLVMPTLR